MQRRPKPSSSLPQQQSASAGNAAALRGEQQQQLRSPARSQSNEVSSPVLHDAPAPSLVVPDRLDSFICVIGESICDVDVVTVMLMVMVMVIVMVVVMVMENFLFCA
jgi:hypothetical protein